MTDLSLVTFVLGAGVAGGVPDLPRLGLTASSQTMPGAPGRP